MFRRSRFSARPNVGTGGRGAAATATPQETPPATQESGDAPTDTNENNTATSAVIENKSDVTSEKAATPEDGSDQTAEGANSSAAVQRRKRFSVKPKVAPGRPPTVSRTPKSPTKSVSKTPLELSGSGAETSLQAVSTRSGNAAAAHGLQSPRRRRSSEGSKSPRVQPKPAPVSSETAEPSVVPPDEDLPEQELLPPDCSSQSENTAGCRVKEVPPVRLPDKVPPSLPDREANEISEKAKTLVSAKTALSLTTSAYSLTRLLNGPSDLQRLVKAQKLRELLKQERCKEKTRKKAKGRPKEYSSDPAKMTMRDLIHYLPTSNPMSYSLEDSTQENETVVPPSPVREASPEPAQEPEPAPNNTANSGGEEEEEGDDEDALMVPQVKVAEDGTLIIDEESLTVEVQRAKGPNPAQDRDPIFERGSTTTYSSFRKGTYTKPWSSEETDMFFLAVSMVGTDFSMICQLFPHRARSEIKNKFKKEERLNSWRIDKAFKERRKLDIEYFSKLLEKILEVQKNRKKLKSLSEKNAPKQRKKRAAAKKPARRLSNVEEVDEEEEDEEDDVPDLEEEGEKENENLCNDGTVPAAEPKRKNKRKNRADASSDEPHGKKSKAGKKSSEQGEVDVPEDAEAALPEENTNSETAQDAAAEKNPVIKPAKLSRARTAKPTLPLGRKRSKKTPKSKDTVSDTEDENPDGSELGEKVNEDASTSSEANKTKAANDDGSDEGEEATVKPPRTMRYGRVPKATKPLTYPGNDDSHSAASPAKPKAKRGRLTKQESPPKSKKPKLVTLRASQSEGSDEENEGPWGSDEAAMQQLPFDSGADGSSAVFVPTGLHTLQPEISEVAESMVELDILASMPDVLGISQEALCPDSSCEQAQHEADTVEPYEHQLDLLVDVIDFLSTEVSEEQSYNEAAQTLLTIGNVAHIAQAAQNQDDYAEDAGPSEDNEATNIEEQFASRPEEESSSSASAQFDQNVSTPSETATTVELNIDVTGTGNQETLSEFELILLSSPASLNEDLTQTNEDLSSNMEPEPESQPEVSAGAVIYEERAPEEAVEPVETSAAESHQTSSELQTPSSTGSQFEPSGPTTKDVNITAESIEEKPTSSAETSETGLEESVTCEATVSEIHQETFTDLATEQESKPTHDAEDSPFRKKEEHEVEAECHSRRSRLQKLKPNLPQASRTPKPKAQTTEKPEETASTSQFIEENLPSHSQTSEPVPETPVQLETDAHPEQKQDDPDSPAVEEILPSQEECDAVPPSQMRRSRFQKIKPNVPQTGRTEKSKPEDRPGLNPEPTSNQSPEHPSPSADPAPAVNPVDITPKESIPDGDKHASPEPPTQVDLSSSAFEERTSEDENLSESQINAAVEQIIREPESTSEISDEIPSSQVQPAEISRQDESTTDSSVTESEVGRESKSHSASEQFQTGQSDGPALVAECVEESPAGREEIQVPSTSQPRRWRLQKLKPKPILLQTSHSRRAKGQITNEPGEKESRQSSTIGVESQQPCPPSPEKPSPPAAPEALSSNLVPPLVSTDVAETQENIKPCTEHPPEPDFTPSCDGNNQRVPAADQISRESSPTEENPESRLQAAESVKDDVLTPDPAESESGIGRGSHEDSSQAQVQESGDNPAVIPRAVETVPVSQEDASTSGAKRSRLQKVKPKPNLPRTRAKKPEPVDDPVAPEPPVEETVTAEITDNTTAETEMQTCCSAAKTETSNQTESLSASGSAPSTEPETKEVASVSEATVQSVSQRRRISKVKPKLSSSSRTAETQSPDVGPPPDLSLKDPDGVETQRGSRTDEGGDLKEDEQLPPAHSSAEEEPASVKFGRGDSKPAAAEPNPQQVVDLSADSCKDGSSPSIVVSADSSSLNLEGDSSVESSNDEKSESTEASQTSRKAPQARRGRILRPKPVLGSRSRRLPPQEAADQVPAEPESGGVSLGVEPSAELRPDTEVSVEGVAVETSSHQMASSSPEAIPRCPLLEDMPPANVSSDPDEPFFILSLTEIPVPWSGGAPHSAAEPPACPTVTDPSERQPSVSAETSVPAGEPSSCETVGAAEESADSGLSDGKDKGSDASNDSIKEDPESSQGTGNVSVEPQQISQTADGDASATKQKPTRGRGRRAKSEVKPDVTKKKPTGETLGPEGAAQDSEQRDVAESQEEKSNVEPDTRTHGKSSRQRRAKAQTAPASNPPPGKAASKGSKAKAPSAKRKQSPPEAAASTSHAAAAGTRRPRKIQTPTVTSPGKTKAERTPDLSSSVSDSHTPEVSGSQLSGSQESEQPISVSQYFFSDIFTEVEGE